MAEEATTRFEIGEHVLIPAVVVIVGDEVDRVLHVQTTEGVAGTAFVVSASSVMRPPAPAAPPTDPVAAA